MPPEPTNPPKQKLLWNEDTEQWETPSLPSPEQPKPPTTIGAEDPPETIGSLQRQRDVADIRAGHRAIRTRWTAIEVGQSTFDYDERPLLWLDLDAENALHWFGNAIHLTPTELRIIILLMYKSGEVVSHAHLYQVLTQGGGETLVEPGQTAWHISRIRHKCKQNAPDLPIYSVNRRGYILRLHPNQIILPELSDPEMYEFTDDMQLVPDNLTKPK